ncbi:IS3 family transposase [Actinobacillus ureae]|uniref:IS3 family transposase n=1 Tax=Actinobacillus ureae TaxID=723 RepID=UPI000E20A554|nr:IS3 family transposase [Actinobacillus ureae]
MTKYNSLFKQQVIEFYLQNDKNRLFTQRHFQLSKKTLIRWIAQFNHNGINGLAAMGKKQKYSPEFKLTVIQAVKKGQFSAESASLHFGIANSGSISQWLQAFEKQSINGLLPKPKGRPTMKPKYPQMPPPPKTEEERLRYRILELEAEVAYLKKLRVDFPLGILLPLTGLKRSTFFYHLPSKIDKNAVMRQKVIEIYQDNDGNYGYRRITLKLRDFFGAINHKRIQGIMQQLDLKGKCKQRKYRSYQGEVGKITENVLQQDFHANAPNEKLVTDITEFKCAKGKRYLSPIKDLFNGEIIAHDLARSPNFEQVMRMLKQAVAKLPKDAKPILHSDQGWQYQTADYQDMLRKHHIRQSMSRKGNGLDNGAMESFFGRLKTECYFGKRFETFEQLEKVIHAYIHYYNNERIQVKLKGLSPVQYRTQSLN